MKLLWFLSQHNWPDNSVLLIHFEWAIDGPVQHCDISSGLEMEYYNYALAY